MEYHQYVVTALYKEPPRVESVRLITNFRTEAHEYDVTSYRGTDWNVYVEDFIVNEKGLVLDHKGVTLIYPVNETDVK